MTIKSSMENKVLPSVDHFKEVNLFVYNGARKFVVLSDGKSRNDTNFSGTVVFGDSDHDYSIGYYNTSWGRAQFSLYTGSVTLSN